MIQGGFEDPAQWPLHAPRCCQPEQRMQPPYPAATGHVPQETFLTPMLRPQGGADGHGGTRTPPPPRIDAAWPLPWAVMQGRVGRGQLGRTGTKRQGRRGKDPTRGGGTTCELKLHNLSARLTVPSDFTYKTQTQR